VDEESEDCQGLETGRYWA